MWRMIDGPHPGPHRPLTKHGWKITSTSGGWHTYTHKNHPGHEVHTDYKGRWQHKNKHGDDVHYNISIGDHLKTFHKLNEDTPADDGIRAAGGIPPKTNRWTPADDGIAASRRDYKQSIRTPADDGIVASRRDYYRSLGKKDVNEVSPPGWSGTVKAMKKHKDITNPFALAWYLKNRGDKPHYKPEKK
jgi:hypothetical protein